MRYAIKALRERKGWSLRVAAKHLASSHSHLDAVEKGRANLSPSLADRAARVYGAPRRQLITDTHDAAVLARIEPFADLVDQATKVAHKSAAAQKQFETRLDDLVAEAEAAVARGEVEAAVLRVLRVLRASLRESDDLADREDDGHGRRVVDEGLKSERDPYGRKVTKSSYPVDVPADHDDADDDLPERDGFGRKLRPVEGSGRDATGRRRR